MLRSGGVTEDFLEEVPSVPGLVGQFESDQTERTGMWLGLSMGSESTKKTNNNVVDFLERVHRHT